MKRKSQRQTFENFIFYTIALKYVQKIKKAAPLRALFMTVYLYEK